MLGKKFFQKDIYITSIWLLLPVINWAVDFPIGRYNNYKIFSSMFWHMMDGKNLYLAYPNDHGDYFFYGPAFSLIIAPFAILPNVMGGLLWGLFNVGILIYAINKLTLKQEIKVLLMALSTIELANSTWAQQFNPCVSAMVILSFAMVEEEKDFYAPFWIMLGAFTKVYGLIGMIFFLFSKNKGKFVLGCFAWSIFFFVAPMVFSSPNYIIQTYLDWYNSLILKNSQLIDSTYSNLSVMGITRKISGYKQLHNLWFIVPGLFLLLSPLLRLKQYSSKHFRSLILSSILMFIVLFSTASEHPTYIICIVGLFLWIILQSDIFTFRNCMIIFFVLILTGLGPTYVFSEEVALFILFYALKALPCIIVWGLLVWDLMTKDFATGSESERFVTTD